MAKRHTTIDILSLKAVNFCGKTIGWEAEASFYEVPFEIEPTTGEEHDYKNCEKCSLNLATFTKNLQERFEGSLEAPGFPLCCSYHANLAKVSEFNRSDFVEVPKLTASKVIFANQHVINNIKSDTWYKDITDYLDWVIESFGQMPANCGEPLFLGAFYHWIADMLNRNDDLPIDRKKSILEFLSKRKIGKDKPDADWNILVNTYEKWLNAFPFELSSYFGNLRERFAASIPILNGNPEVNPYSGKVAGKIHTQSSLVQLLISLTKELLNAVDARSLVEQGIISDVYKHRFELESESLRIATGRLTKSFSKGELKYIKVLKKWLNLHKEYFEKIAPLVKGKLVQKEEERAEEQVNNFVESTIEDWLFPFKEERVLTETAYSMLVGALRTYFETNAFPEIAEPIRVGKVSVKRFGWALKEVFRSVKSQNEKLSIAYLLFAKQNISIFINVPFDENNMVDSTLYKYFTTKTK